MPTASCEGPLAIVQTLGREQAARRQGGREAGLARWGLRVGLQAAGARGVGVFLCPAFPGHLLVTRREGQKQLLWQGRGSQGFGSASVLPHGASSCHIVLPHGAGLCRRPLCPWAGGQQGLTPFLLSFCSSCVVKELWVDTLLG